MRSQTEGIFRWVGLRTELNLILGILVLVAVNACNNHSERQQMPDPAQLKKPLIHANQELVASEEEDIEGYIQRHGWKMEETGSGLRYMIYEHGRGPIAEEGNIVQFNYELSLLTGKVCYSSEKSGPKEFVVGHGGVESGLEEAILLLHEGDKVKIILPSHLAFGLVGDDAQIPRKAAIVYNLELIAVLNPQNLK